MLTKDERTELLKKKFTNVSRVGGKGTRRRVKKIPRSATGDEACISSISKKFGLKEETEPANVFMISGSNVTKFEGVELNSVQDCNLGVFKGKAEKADMTSIIPLYQKFMEKSQFLSQQMQKTQEEGATEEVSNETETKEEDETFATDDFTETETNITSP